MPNPSPHLPAVAKHVAEAPQRIQLRRTKGWRMPENTVKVDRTTKWGNPFGVSGKLTAAQAVYEFRLWINQHTLNPAGLFAPSLPEIRRELGGKNLACWCKPGAVCHADVLLELANGGA